MKDVPTTLTKDRAFMLELVKTRPFPGELCEFLPKEYFDDQEILAEAVKSNNRAIFHLMKRDKDRFEANRELCLIACTEYSDSLKYVGSKFKADREIVTAAVKDRGYILQEASEELRNDPELMKLSKA